MSQDPILAAQAAIQRTLADLDAEADRMRAALTAVKPAARPAARRPEDTCPQCGGGMIIDPQSGNRRCFVCTSAAPTPTPTAPPPKRRGGVCQCPCGCTENTGLEICPTCTVAGNLPHA